MNGLSATWAASEKGDFLIKSQLAAGAFSSVYLVEHKRLAYDKAWKVARPAAIMKTDNAMHSVAMVTGAAGTVGFADVDPSEILQGQLSRMQAVEHVGGVVRAYGCKIVDGQSVMEMDYHRVPNLREFMSSNPVPVDLLARTARLFDQLSVTSNFNYHGDIKPENLLVGHGQSLLIIDPGFFGQLHVDGALQQACVTTRGYYPFLQPDDLFAFGVMLWEIASKHHPLTGRTTKGSVAAGHQLRAWVNSTTHARPLIEPLLKLQLLSEVKPDLPPLVQTILLKALRLKINTQGELDIATGYLTFADIADSLDQICAQGVTHF
jgi:serine/threonine protein kinase